VPRHTAVPFDAFLDVLRAKGFGVGLPEYAAMANLLGHWDRTNVGELGDALAALIGRNDDEVRGIRRLFDEIYAPPPLAPPPPPPAIPGPLTFLRRHAWALALVGAVVLLVAVGLAVNRDAPAPPTPVAPVVPPIATPAADNAVAIPPPPAPELPPAPIRVERRLAAGVLSGGFLAALALFWSMKVREDRRAWLREAWSTVRATLPGPYHFREIVRDQAARLPRSDVEDAATLLGRVFSRNAQARELDVPRSLRATLRRGLMPTLVTKPRRIAETVLVLQDVCQDMRIWEAKVEAFLTDLRRQGISLHRLYFDGDPSRLSERPHRPAGSMDAFLRNRPDSPVLIISSGAGLAAALTVPDPAWPRLLGGRLRKTWLTPVADVRLWPRGFARLPLDVWPMTRLGLSNAARQLAGLELESAPDVRARIASEGRVTVEDIERLKRLASLVPHPTPALLDLLRRRFAADIPDGATIHLMTRADGAAAPLIEMDDAEVRRCLIAVRRENPDLEAAVRQTVLGVLADSEPVPGSAAHERWQIAVEVQRLLLADVAGAQTDATASVEALRSLAHGPMWQEVQEALRILPAAPGIAQPAKELARTERAVPNPDSGDRRLAVAGPMPWSWPGPRELVPAALVALLLLLGGLSLNAFPRRDIQHVQDAYELTYTPTPSASTPQLTVTRRLGDAAIPQRVTVYRDDQVFRAGIDLTAGAPTTIQLAAEDTGSYYQVRASLEEGNLALSNAVWVTSDQLRFVAFDASPWANVTVQSVMTFRVTAQQPTPFTAALLPGAYDVTFENPSLNPPSAFQQRITVGNTDTTVRVTMPGFEPERAVDTLLQGAPAQGR
jgi:hypothetical protein